MVANALLILINASNGDDGDLILESNCFSFATIIVGTTENATNPAPITLLLLIINMLIIYIYINNILKKLIN